MHKINFLSLFPIFIFGGFFILIWSMIKASISRVLPDNYKDLKRRFPNPLKRLRFLGGHIGSVVLKNSLKLDIYPYQLIVSTMGKALCLDYFSYSFDRQDFLFAHALVINSIQDCQRNDKEGILAPTNETATKLTNWINSRKNPFIVVNLSKKDLDLIMDLVQQAQQSRQ